MESRYKKQLRDFEKLNIMLYEILVADELECLVDNLEQEINDKQFDMICDYAYSYCMNSEATPNEIVNAIIYALNNEKIKFGEYGLESCDEKDIDYKMSDIVCYLS